MVGLSKNQTTRTMKTNTNQGQTEIVKEAVEAKQGMPEAPEVAKLDFGQL